MLDPRIDVLTFLTLGLLPFSVCLGAHRTGTSRAFCIGFVLFGGGCLSLGLIQSTVPRLITTKAMPHPHQPKIVGIRAYKMRIHLLPDRMRACGVSSQDIMWALTPSTIVGSPMGFVTKTWQSKQYELTHTSLLNRPELFENMILRASPDGEVLRLRDVAEVEMVSSVYIPSVGAEVD